MVSLYALPAIIAFTINISLTIIIILDSPKKTENRLFSLALFCTALWNAGEALLISADNISTANSGILLMQSGIAATPLLFLLLSFIYPRRKSPAKLKWYMIILLSVIPAILALNYPGYVQVGTSEDILMGTGTRYWFTLNGESPLTYLKVFQSFIYLAWGWINFYRAYKGLKSRREKDSAQYVIYGIVIFSVLFLALNTQKGSEITRMFLSSILLMCVSIFFSYAILENRFIILKRYFQTSLRVAVISAAILTLYVYVIKTTAEILSSFYTVNRIVAELIMIFILSLLVYPFITRIQNLLSEILSQNYTRFRNKVLRFLQDSSNTFSIEELLKNTEEFLIDIFGVKDAYVLMPDAENKNFVFKDGDKTVKISVDSDVIRHLSEIPVTCETDYLMEISGKQEGLFLSAFSGGLIVPLMSESRLKGLVILERKKGGQVFATEEIDSLTVFSNPICTLIERNQTLHKIKEEEMKSSQMEKFAAIGRMTAGIAHEIRNPMNIISTAAETILKKQNDSETVNKLLYFIVEEVDRMNKIVSDFLQLSKPVSLNIEKRDVVAFLKIIAEQLKLGYKDYNVDIEVKNTGEVFIETDFDALRHIVMNLCSNSFEAIQQNGKIQLGIAEEPGKTVITISDTGGGIPEENKDKVFDLFFSTKQTGTGLGLSIVLSLIENLKGEIMFENSGSGAVFTIKLPKK